MLLYLNCLPADFWLLVFLSLPYSAVSWSALSDCGISLSYLLTFLQFLVYYNQNKSVILSKLLNCLSVH